jgi:hypothetical protein
MKFLPKKVVWELWGWNDTEEESAELVRKRNKQCIELRNAYDEHLDSTRNRISKPAYEFFRHGFAETGLHDADLLSLNVGCGLNFVAVRWR